MSEFVAASSDRYECIIFKGRSTSCRDTLRDAAPMKSRNSTTVAEIRPALVQAETSKT